MKFHLVYSGPLRGSGNRSKPEDVLKIRRQLSPQLEHLWDTHNALQILKDSGAVVLGGGTISTGRPLRQVMHVFPEMILDLCSDIEISGKSYLPLVRESLALSCELEILFLRQADPGALISQGGDIDNRIKTLLDALRMPDAFEQNRCSPPENRLFCLMESDHLISRLDVKTDRLLFPQSEKPDEVHLVIAVKINVLRVKECNMCLL